ncbi:unnamed protein product [Paramecium pentaurelia]|uniref:Uncharacterized protein n=1 Tax=Paramecium pentaurelia TaxID=43138 RepID=A0A8S1SPB6_9CILI|nr:unnamed protein product [Paramecium pentaurelia]
MKVKPKLSSNNQTASFNKEKDELLQKNSSTQMNSDLSITNPKVEQTLQKFYETPTNQGDDYSQEEQIQQKIQQQDLQVPQQEIDNHNQKQESSIISELEGSQNHSTHDFLIESEKISQILDQSLNIFDDKIKLKYNDQNFIIQLKNNQILQIIEQIYLEKWNLLIKQLNLNKQSMNCYRLQQPTDYFYINQEIQNFIDSIQLVEVQFCFYSCYTMKEQQSMMNKFLQSHQIQVAQVGDDFYLVSRQQSLQFLEEIQSQIYQNYRGYMFNFTSAKPYSNTISNNPILEKSRYLFYKKYLTLDVQLYSFNQYFNENLFFIEMNFVNIKENRELVEKYIKDYVGDFIKNLFLLQFSIQTSQDILIKIQKTFENCMNQLQLKILFYKNNDDFILFGINEDIQKLLSLLQTQELKFPIKKFEVEFDKQNFLFKLKGAQQKIDFKSFLDLLKEFGLEQKENKKLRFSTQSNKNQNLITLVNSLKILNCLCNIREQNNNRIALQILHKKFRTAIDQKDLKKEIAFLHQINPNNNEQVQQQQQVITLNIRSEILQFPISQTITLNPEFLDEIIQENLYQEFLDQLVKNDSTIQFQKILQGKYQLQCMNNQVVTQFKQYFDKFQHVKLNLDKSSLSCFELSHYLKKELKKRSIFWKIMEQGQLYLITRNNESLKYAQEFKQYKGKIIQMLSLNATNLNENIEYHQLVLARTNYFKYKIQEFLKQNLIQIKEIEFREEQEISSFCIIHTNLVNQEQSFDKCIEQIQSLIRSKIFLELKTKSEIGKKILEKIIDISDLYVSQKQQYSDYYITMLGNIKNFQKIEELFQNIDLSNEQFINISISFYIEEFIPYRNIIQKTQTRNKFKKFLESKGFTVDATKIKWIIETKLQQSKFMIFSYLIEWINQDTIQNIRNSNILNIEMMGQSAININDQQNSYQDIEISLLTFLDNKHNNKDDNRNKQIIQQIGNIENSGFLENSYNIQDQFDRMSRSEISDQDSNANVFNIGNQIYDVLAEFTKSIQKYQLPPASELAQILKEQYPNQNVLVYQPYVDQNYKQQFYRQANQIIDLYVIQKPDKVYKEIFSKNMLFILKAKCALEKFMSHQNLILIVFQANRNCKYSQHSDKEKISLLEDNQVLPYLFLKRK